MTATALGLGFIMRYNGLVGAYYCVDDDDDVGNDDDFVFVVTLCI